MTWQPKRRLAGPRGQLADSMSSAYDLFVSAVRFTGERSRRVASTGGLCAVVWTALARRRRW